MRSTCLLLASLLLLALVLPVAGCGGDSATADGLDGAEVSVMEDAVSPDSGSAAEDAASGDEASDAAGQDVEAEASQDSEGDLDAQDSPGPDGLEDVGGPAVIEPPEPLDLELSTLSVGGVEYAFAANVAYGPDARHVLDIAMPESEAPTALVLFIHGGGFVGGNKDGVWDNAGAVAPFLESGIAFASSTYRLLETVDAEGVIKPLGDSRRALQFLRYHAASFGIDATRVAAFGSSAGAGTALWLGTSDDMADPTSEDPVERLSTRLVAVGARATQASYDLVRWETDIYDEMSLTLEIVAAVDEAFAQRLYSFYGVDSLDGLYTPDITAYREEVDMLGNMDADDAPIHVTNDLDYTGLPVNTDQFFHHPLHAAVLGETAASVGLEHVVYAPALDLAHPSGESLIDFLLRHLTEPVEAD